MRFTLAHSDLPEAEKTQILDSLDVVNPIIQYNYLYFAISKKKPNWQSTLDMVNKAIQEFESKGLVFQIIKETLKFCHLQMDETFSPYQNAQP